MTLTIAAALAQARACGVDRLDAQLLLGHVLGRSRTWLLAHDEEALTSDAARTYGELARRRAAGEPFAYLVGEREFRGLALAVSPAVLVPRPDTETLVEWALALLEGEMQPRASPKVLDLGTGSGAIALALKQACPRAQVWAVDRSAAALAVAQQNANQHGLEVAFAQGDWWWALPPTALATPFDLVVSNPPYLADGDPHLAALAYEPRDALVAAENGLADLARIATAGAAHIGLGGWLLFEHGWTQAPAVRELLAGAGFGVVETRTDIEGRPRCTGAKRLPSERQRDSSLQA